MKRVLQLATNLFPVWVLIAAALALVRPAWFTWFDRPKIVWGLGVIMLGMGVTLTVDDFRRALRMPKPVAAGVAAQFLIMPFVGWAVARAMGLPREFALGLILVACCPGGTASNVVTFLARAHLPLSVLMTMCSTILAVVMTPYLTKLYASAYVAVDAPALVWTTAKVVLLPVAAGVALHHLAPKLVGAVEDLAPLVSVVTIALICGSIIGSNVAAIRAHGRSLVVSVALVHGLAFFLGYWFAKLFGFEKIVRRTVSIEVGMQNSGLGTVLAKTHFANPLTGVCLPAVPCAISATFHSIIGSFLAGFWRLRPVPLSEPTPGSLDRAAPQEPASEPGSAADSDSPPV
ncbi:MAG: bile acid:sodium symporter family protein [Verrucomicrobia bacterium]|nr:bile acid:sodium symporter family protein [Verrucomicrobiota bacterium]